MKNIILILLLLNSSYNLAITQNKNQIDIWSGTYVILAKINDNLKSIDTLTIEKSTDANPRELTDKYKSDTTRWLITSSQGKQKEKNKIRRFLYNPNNKIDEYKEFGWSELHHTNKINCIDGTHFFICQTLEKTLVNFGQNEKYTTNTGIFGVWLHYGVVELRKINHTK